MPGSLDLVESTFQGPGVTGSVPKGKRCKWDPSSPGSLAGMWESKETWHIATPLSRASLESEG